MPRKRYSNQEAFFKKLGQRIKELRIERGYTQEDMMEYGLSCRFYQRIEAGKPIHMKTVLKIADAFGLKVSELIVNL
jgi:transcriptional regulator with XRE-family HTH domain